MTRYLLDTNVVREIGPRGHRNVNAWLATIDDAQLFLSVVTLLEIRRGWEIKRRRDPAAAEAGLARVAALETAYRARIIPVDRTIAAEWARLIGTRDKHRDDMALAATARIGNFVLVTRNVADFVGREVRVLNPFKSPCPEMRV